MTEIWIRILVAVIVLYGIPIGIASWLTWRMINKK